MLMDLAQSPPWKEGATMQQQCDPLHHTASKRERECLAKNCYQKPLPVFNLGVGGLAKWPSVINSDWGGEYCQQ